MEAVLPFLAALVIAGSIVYLANALRSASTNVSDKLDHIQNNVLVASARVQRQVERVHTQAKRGAYVLCGGGLAILTGLVALAFRTHTVSHSVDELIEIAEDLPGLIAQAASVNVNCTNDVGARVLTKLNERKEVSARREQSIARYLQVFRPVLKGLIECWLRQAPFDTPAIVVNSNTDPNEGKSPPRESEDHLGEAPCAPHPSPVCSPVHVAATNDASSFTTMLLPMLQALSASKTHAETLPSVVAPVPGNMALGRSEPASSTAVEKPQTTVTALKSMMLPVLQTLSASYPSLANFAGVCAAPQPTNLSEAIGSIAPMVLDMLAARKAVPPAAAAADATPLTPPTTTSLGSDKPVAIVPNNTSTNATEEPQSAITAFTAMLPVLNTLSASKPSSIPPVNMSEAIQHIGPLVYEMLTARQATSSSVTTPDTCIASKNPDAPDSPRSKMSTPVMIENEDGCKIPNYNP